MAFEAPRAAGSAQPGPPRGGVTAPSTKRPNPAMSTMAFEAPPGYGGGKTKGFSQTVAFDGGDAQAAVDAAKDAIRQAPAPAKRSDLMSTVAFGATSDEVAPPATRGKTSHQTMSFGAVSGGDDLMKTVAYAESVEEATDALRRMEAKTAMPGPEPEDAAGGLRQGRKKPKWGATMAFGELSEDVANLRSPAQPQAGEEAGPKTSRHPGVEGPQAVVATGSPMTSPSRKRSRGGLNATMAFEAPIQDAVDEARAKAEASAAQAQPSQKVVAQDFTATMAFAPELEDQPKRQRPAAGAAPTGASRGASLSSTVAFESPYADADADEALFGASAEDAAAVGTPSSPQSNTAASDVFAGAAAASKRAAFQNQKVASRKATMMGGLGTAPATAEEAARELAEIRAQRAAEGQPLGLAPAAVAAPASQVASSPPADLGHLQGDQLLSTVASAGLDDARPVAMSPPVVNVEAAPESVRPPPVAPPSGLPIHPQQGAPMGHAPHPGGMAPSGLPASAPLHLQQPAMMPPNQQAPLLAPEEGQRTPVILIVAFGSVLLGVAIVLLLWKLVL